CRQHPSAPAKSPLAFHWIDTELTQEAASAGGPTKNRFPNGDRPHYPRHEKSGKARRRVSATWGAGAAGGKYLARKYRLRGGRAGASGHSRSARPNPARGSADLH